MSQNVTGDKLIGKIKENIFNQFTLEFLNFVRQEEYISDTEQYFWDYYNQDHNYKKSVIEVLVRLCFSDVDMDYIELEYIFNLFPGIRELSYSFVDALSEIIDTDILYDQLEGIWETITELGEEYIAEHIDQILKINCPICNKLAELEDDAEYKQKQANKNAQYKEWGVPTDEEVFGEKEWGDW